MFSIITPLYNKSSYIKETIDSVLNQSYPEFEIIVVNDSSTDDSLSVVESIHDDRLKVYTKPNGGVSAARNYGIARAQYPYVCFLDADDLWATDYLEQVKTLIEQYPNAGMFLTGFYYFVENKDNITKENTLKKYNKSNSFIVDDYFKASLFNRCSICLTSAVTVRKEILNSMTELFPLGIHCGEDVDLWTRIALKTPVAYLNCCKMLYRFSTSNSLYVNYSNSMNSSFRYDKWFDYKSDSPYYVSYVNMYLFYLANQLFANGNYNDALKVLKKYRGLGGSWVFVSSVKLGIKLILKRIVGNKK